MAIVAIIYIIYTYKNNIGLDGILLYDGGEFILSEAKKLPWSERKPIAEKNYEYCFDRGKGFLISVNTYFEIN
jgi:hypothetical protein